MSSPASNKNQILSHILGAGMGHNLEPKWHQDLPMVRHDPNVPVGWTRQYVQVPITLAKTFKAATDSRGWGGSKMLSTASLLLGLGLPSHALDALIQFIAANNSSGRIQDVSPEEAWRIVESALRIGPPAIEESSMEYMRRILDDSKPTRVEDETGYRLVYPPTQQGDYTSQMVVHFIDASKQKAASPRSRRLNSGGS